MVPKFNLRCTSKRGTNARKIRNVKGKGGHENPRRNPDKMLKSSKIDLLLFSFNNNDKFSFYIFF